MSAFFGGEASLQFEGKFVRRIVNRDDAVSPVIATILLLAITVLLVGAVFLMISSNINAPDKGMPMAKMSARSLDNGYQVVTISEMSGQMETFRCQFHLLPPEGSNQSSITGYASDADVYGVAGANVSFQDRDAGFTVNTGDYWVIDASTLGTGTGEWTFRMLYDGGGGRTGGEVASVVLPVTT